MLKLNTLLQTGEEAIKEFMDAEGVSYLCRLLLNTFVDEIRINVLKILNYLVTQNPDVHYSMGEAGYPNSLLHGLSQSKESHHLAVQAKTLLNNKLNYFTEKLTGTKGEAADRSRWINALAALCRIDREEYRFFANFAGALLLCAMNPKEDKAVSAAALNAFKLFIENDLSQHFEVLSNYQNELRSLAIATENIGGLRDTAIALLHFFDKEFKEILALNAKISADFNQALAAENTNKIPDLIKIASNDKVEMSFKILALDTLAIFVLHPENQVQMGKIIPLLTNLSNSNDGLLSFKAEALLNILIVAAREKGIYGQTFFENMGNLYESLDELKISRGSVLPFNDILSAKATVLPILVKAPIGEVGSVERKIYDLLEALKNTLNPVSGEQAQAFAEGMDIIEQFNVIINTETDARLHMMMQSASGVLNNFAEYYNDSLTDEARISILMLRGLRVYHSLSKWVWFMLVWKQNVEIIVKLVCV